MIELLIAGGVIYFLLPKNDFAGKDHLSMLPYMPLPTSMGTGQPIPNNGSVAIGTIPSATAPTAGQPSQLRLVIDNIERPAVVDGNVPDSDVSQLERRAMVDIVTAGVDERLQNQFVAWTPDPVKNYPIDESDEAVMARLHPNVAIFYPRAPRNLSVPDRLKWLQNWFGPWDIYTGATLRPL